jgi:aerobic carbon-monoxide dehydrogenase large subunit
VKTNAEREARPTLIGVRLPRVEDDRLLSGRGSFLADLHLPGMVEAVFVRSPFAHAAIRSIQMDAAKASPGVAAAVAAADLDGMSAFPDFFQWARPVKAFPLRTDRVRHVGAPVAVVVAGDRYQAEDAAELVEVDYDPLATVASIDEALAPDAPLLYEDWPDNRVVHSSGVSPETDEVFAAARRIVRGRYSIQRHTAIPMETRGCVAEFRDGRLTLWSTTQFPHIARTMLSYLLPLSEREIRVIAPDIGGGFGCKAEFYPEDAVVAWLAMHLGRPVRFVEDRAEHMVSAAHARDMVIELEGAVEEDGRISALRGTILQDLGSSELYPPGFNMAFTCSGSLTGPYRIPHQSINVTCVATNKSPAGAYRGFGIPEATFAMERLVDKAAREAGLDPLEVRRRMLIGPEDLPYTTAAGAVLDSGSHRAAFEAMVEAGRKALERHRSRFAGEPRTRVGLGVANYVEGVAPTYFGTTGNWTGHDGCTIRVEPDGGITVGVGVMTSGQGVWTMVATLAAEAMGVPLEQIRVVMGDTDTSPYGLGSWGSRSTNVAGGAMLKAAAAVREKALRIAAHLLETAPEDLVIEDGQIHVAGSPESSVSWADIGRVAYLRTMELPPGEDPGLEATAWYDLPGVDHVPRQDGRMNACLAYTNASHAVVLKVDVETGEVEILEYLIAHDCGRVINPTIVEGQIHGGVAQGIGGALYEYLAYGSDAQPQATTFMDYLLPTAAESPPMVIQHFESPAPGTAFGAKGAGEAGVIGPAAAIASALEDALAEFGIDEITETPLSPPVVRRLIQQAKARV